MIPQPLSRIARSLKSIITQRGVRVLFTRYCEKGVKLFTVMRDEALLVSQGDEV